MEVVEVCSLFGSRTEHLAWRWRHFTRRLLFRRRPCRDVSSVDGDSPDINMPSRLEHLFDVYAADLKRFAPQWSDHFGCPLCLKVLKRVANLRNIVAEEHVVPKQLGGRIVTLTCRKCNSEHGAKLDAHLVQRVRIEANARPMKVRFKMGTATMGTEMETPLTPTDPIRIKVIAKQSDPRQIEEVKRLLREGETNINLHGSFGYNENRSLVALVRSVYLLMFRVFGYRYVLDSSAAVVREQLDKPLERTSVLNGIMWRVTDTVPEGSTVCIMHSPESLHSFFVMVGLDGQKHVAGVTLPAPGTDGTDLYSHLQSPEARGAKLLTPLPMPKRGFLPFIEAWRDIVEGPRSTG